MVLPLSTAIEPVHFVGVVASVQTTQPAPFGSLLASADLTKYVPISADMNPQKVLVVV